MYYIVKRLLPDGINSGKTKCVIAVPGLTETLSDPDPTAGKTALPALFAISDNNFGFDAKKMAGLVREPVTL